MGEDYIKRPDEIPEDMEAVNAIEADIELDNFVEKYKTASYHLKY